MRLFALGFVLGTLLLQREALLPQGPWALAGAALLLAAVPARRNAIARLLLLAAAGLSDEASGSPWPRADGSLCAGST
jgi:hypothetical protein